MPVDNKNKDILILSEGPTQGLDDTALTAEGKYSINFSESKKRFFLSLHYNGTNTYLFVNGVEIHKCKPKGFEISAIWLCLGKISKDVLVDNLKKTGLNPYVFDFSVDCNTIAVDDILDIHKFWMKKE